MSTAAVGTTDLKAGASPPARTAGLFCLLVFFFNGSALFVRSGLVISGDAAATASNIMAHASRFWLGLTCNLIMIACFIAVTTLFYELFKPMAIFEIATSFWLLFKGLRPSAVAEPDKTRA